MMDVSILLQYIGKKYGLGHAVHCVTCRAVICSRNRLNIFTMDDHLRCCSKPYTNRFIGSSDFHFSGLFNASGRLMVMGLEFKT